MTKQEIINYSDLKFDCPFSNCDGKLDYIAYTAFSCPKCKRGFSIGIHKAKVEEVDQFQRNFNRLQRECSDLPYNALIELLEGMPTEKELWGLTKHKLLVIRDIIRQYEHRDGNI